MPVHSSAYARELLSITQLSLNTSARHKNAGPHIHRRLVSHWAKTAFKGQRFSQGSQETNRGAQLQRLCWCCVFSKCSSKKLDAHSRSERPGHALTNFILSRKLCSLHHNRPRRGLTSPGAVYEDAWATAPSGGGRVPRTAVRRDGAAIHTRRDGRNSGRFRHRSPSRGDGNHCPCHSATPSTGCIKLYVSRPWRSPQHTTLRGMGKRG